MLAYSASRVKRKSEPGRRREGLPVGGTGEGAGGGEGESRLGGHLGTLREGSRACLVDVDVAEAGKARQLGGAAGRQNLRPPPAPPPLRPPLPPCHLTEIEPPPTPPGTSFFFVDRL